jgi:hypothetical protein
VLQALCLCGVFVNPLVRASFTKQVFGHVS